MESYLHPCIAFASIKPFDWTVLAEVALPPQAEPSLAEVRTRSSRWRYPRLTSPPGTTGILLTLFNQNRFILQPIRPHLLFRRKISSPPSSCPEPVASQQLSSSSPLPYCQHQSHRSRQPPSNAHAGSGRLCQGRDVNGRGNTSFSTRIPRMGTGTGMQVRHGQEGDERANRLNHARNQRKNRA